MHEPYDFGIILRDLRKSKGYTQKRLADMLGLSVTAVSKYEINQSSPPLETLRAISNILRLSKHFVPFQISSMFLLMNCWELSSVANSLLQG